MHASRVMRHEEIEVVSAGLTVGHISLTRSTPSRAWAKLLTPRGTASEPLYGGRTAEASMVGASEAFV